MGILRGLLCIIFPPLAVLDKGCGAVLLTLLLTAAGWIPGVIAAIIFNNK
ncbi:YqaE/Pmp3 family membrane protein [Treponema sp.]